MPADESYPSSSHGLKESSYSPSSSASYPSSAALLKESSKFTLPDGETLNLDGLNFPGSYASSSFSELSKASPSSASGYESDAAGLGEDDLSAFSALSSQMNPYPSLSGAVPQSELSFLLNKMPRGGFSPVPAGSHMSFTPLRPTGHHYNPGFGYPRVTSPLHHRRPVFPGYATAASSPYLKVSRRRFFLSLQVTRDDHD